MLFGPKLKCPKCEEKAKPRTHYENEQAECQNPDCGYTGDTEEFDVKKQKRKKKEQGRSQ